MKALIPKENTVLTKIGGKLIYQFTEKSSFQCAHCLYLFPVIAGDEDDVYEDGSKNCI